MARASGSAVENTFVKGLITEATGLNFPENAVTDQNNCVFEKTGLVHRRLGIDLEDGGSLISTDDLDIGDIGDTVTAFLWKTAGAGSNSFVVIQIDTALRFFEVSNGALSLGLKPFLVDLMANATAPTGTVIGRECSYATGGNFLFVVHPFMNPIVVVYDRDTDTISTTAVPIRVRDLEGLTLQYDNMPVNRRPGTLTRFHKYNLYNQGWYFKGTAAA